MNLNTITVSILKPQKIYKKEKLTVFIRKNLVSFKKIINGVICVEIYILTMYMCFKKVIK